MCIRTCAVEELKIVMTTAIGSEFLWTSEKPSNGIPLNSDKNTQPAGCRSSWGKHHWGQDHNPLCLGRNWFQKFLVLKNCVRRVSAKRKLSQLMRNACKIEIMEDLVRVTCWTFSRLFGKISCHSTTPPISFRKLEKYLKPRIIELWNI